MRLLSKILLRIIQLIYWLLWSDDVYISTSLQWGVCYDEQTMVFYVKNLVWKWWNVLNYRWGFFQGKKNIAAYLRYGILRVLIPFLYVTNLLPSTSKEYTRWRNLTLTIVPRMLYSKVGPSQVIKELVKRKRVNNEEDLKEQVEKLQTYIVE